MKKVFALMMVSAFAVAIVACGGKKEEAAETTPVVDTVAAPAPVDTVAVDTAAAPAATPAQ